MSVSRDARHEEIMAEIEGQMNSIKDYNRFNDPHRAYSNYPSLLEYYKENPSIPMPSGDVEDYVIEAWNVAHK